MKTYDLTKLRTRNLEHMESGRPRREALIRETQCSHYTHACITRCVAVCPHLEDAWRCPLVDYSKEVSP